MNYEEIRYYLQQQLEGAEGRGEIENGMALLNAANYLLQRFAEEPAALSQGEGRQLQRAFSYCGGITRSTMALAGTYQARLGSAEERIAGVLHERAKAVEAAVRDMERVDAALDQAEARAAEAEEKARELEEKREKLESAEAALLAGEEALRARQRELDEAARRVEDLKAVEAKVSPERAAALEEELAELRERTGPLQEAIAALQGQFDGRFTSARELDRRAELLSRLAEAREALHGHLSEDERLTGEISREGFVAEAGESEKDFRGRAEELRKRGEECVAAYDELLGAVLEDAEQACEQIEKRQKEQPS